MGSRASAKKTTSRESFSEMLGGHAPDVAAVTCVILGAIVSLGLASNLAGPIGGWFASGASLLLGRGSVLVPSGFFVAALLFYVFGREETHVPGAPFRVLFGGILLLFASTTALHVLNGAPGFDTDRIRKGGGLIGFVVGGPLHAGLGTVGTWVVLIGIGVLGALLVPGVPMRRVFALISTGVLWAWEKVRAGFELPEEFRESEVDITDDLESGEELDSDYDDENDEFVEEESDEEYEDEEPEPEEVAAASVLTIGDEPQLAIDLGPGHRQAAWKLPPSNLLKRSSNKEIDHRIVEEGGEVLKSTLHEFGVDAALTGMTIGPTVTRYELELGSGVKVNRITSLSHDLAYALATPDVRVLAPIPGRSAIGIEVPNKQRQLVTLGDVLSSPEAARATHPLQVGLGRDISGSSLMVNLAEMPHLLIAGATGAGKSSCINSIVTSVVMRSTPEQVRMILVDPKRVELGAYNDLPHLLTPVVTNPKKAANALDWAVREMDMRYGKLADAGVRDITGYNAAFDRGELPTVEHPDETDGKAFERLPYILVIVDELNDLMMVAARDVEASICRIAQMARAVGIHLVIATQRPSVDVITGVIKANVPSRLAFSVSSLADSRVILDSPGAEKLIGQGDMLMLSASSNKPQRVQGSWVDEECVRKVVAHWKRQSEGPEYVDGIADETSGSSSSYDAGDDDDLLSEAMELVVRSGVGSTSMLQRKLRIGFSRAGRLMDLLERKGVVGPSEGSKARSVMMSIEEFEALEELHELSQSSSDA